MNVLLVVLVAVMALVAIVLLGVAIWEFIRGCGEKKAEPVHTCCKQVEEPAPVQPVAQPEPVVEEAPVVEEEVAPVVEEEVAPVAEEDDQTVSFGVSNARLTLREEYEAQPAESKKWFDAIVGEAATFEKARCKESQYAYTVMQGQDTIGKMKYSKGVLMLDCTIVNAELKAYGKESGSKIKNKPIRFKITDDKVLEDALYTLRLANQVSFEARAKKKPAKAE